MQAIDYTIIGIYFVFSFVIAILIFRKSGGNTENFFLSGRSLPWWISGTAMVATTFAADTPLAVTELVAASGIAGNWLWWNMVAGNVLTVFFFARLWRRADILTDVEFIELRYSGRPAALLRGFKAVYLGVFMNTIIMGWVNVALAEIFRIIFGVGDDQILIWIFGSMIFVGVYSAISGLWGISLTDVFQFIIAMTGCIILAVYVLDLPQIGGVDGLKKALPEDVFLFVPRVSMTAAAAGTAVLSLSFSAFMAHLFIQWWSSWYPGSEPGGGGYIAQRMMSSKDERHSILATLWFTIAHYALRPWPWIIVALCSMVLYPGLSHADKKSGFILAMRDHLPPGLVGLLVAAFLAAYMSTISTHLNWGTSYIINDLYKRFIARDRDERHYVLVSRLVTIVLVFLSTLTVLAIKTISGAWSFIIECGAGLGLVLILRWYWWRINAWSEIAAMTAPFIAYPLARYVFKISFPESLFFIVLFTTVCWIAATFVTKPVDETVLKKFYERVRPGGAGWKKTGGGGGESIRGLFIDWLLGIVMVYSFLFSIGKIIFGEYFYGAGLAILGLGLLFFISRRLKSGEGGRNEGF